MLDLRADLILELLNLGFNALRIQLLALAGSSIMCQSTFGSLWASRFSMPRYPASPNTPGKSRKPQRKLGGANWSPGQVMSPVRRQSRKEGQGNVPRLSSRRLNLDCAGCRVSQVSGSGWLFVRRPNNNTLLSCSVTSQVLVNRGIGKSIRRPEVQHLPEVQLKADASNGGCHQLDAKFGTIRRELRRSPKKWVPRLVVALEF